MKTNWNSEKGLQYGLLLLRVGIGLMFITVHGYPKISGGVENWTKLGEAFISVIGIPYFPAFWGFMAAASEFVGGMCLVTGILFRPACFLMLFTMFVAVVINIQRGYGFTGGAQAFECGVVFLCLLLTGPGVWTLHNLLFARKNSIEKIV